jgi:S1-C subfamily serine protease
MPFCVRKSPVRDDAPQPRTTEMKKLLLATAAVMAALASPVQAETVNGWTIEYWPDASAGACAAGMNYPSSKTKLLFVRMYNAQNNNASEWGIMLTNNTWKTKDKKYEVIVETEAKGPPKKTLIKSFNGTDSGGLVARDFTIEEMNILAFDAEAIVRFINKRDGTVIAYLRIDNSAPVIRAVVNCLKGHEPIVVAKQDATIPKKEQASKGPYYGTGFFVAPKYVLTSYHILEKCAADKLFIKYPTYRAEQAVVSAYDKKNDLALLKTEMKNFGIAKFRLRGRLGEQVASYGFPYGNTLSSSGNFTLGNITALAGFGDDSTMVQVSSPMQPGNSGGPLMDSSGTIIGVSKGILGTLAAAEAAGGAVPQNVNFGVSSGTAVTFLGTRGIDAEVSVGASKLEPEALAEIAMKFTVQISCD